jgi:hypothetical protein
LSVQFFVVGVALATIRILDIYIYMQMFQHALSGGNSDSNSRRNGNRTIEIMYNSNGGINEVQS